MVQHPGATARHTGWRRRLAALAAAVVTFAVAAALSPFALVEQRSTGVVLDTAGDVSGQEGTATDGLRRLGFTCFEGRRSGDLLERSCTRVHLVSSARVSLVVASRTGQLETAQVSLDEGLSSTRSHRAILEVLGAAIGLATPDRIAVMAAAGSGRERSLRLGWGVVTVRPDGDSPGSVFRSTGSTGTPALPRTTLAGSVDALAAAATRRGYTCSEPQVRTVRDCTRTADGYGYDLWIQGTDRYLTTLELHVTSAYGRRTRAHWTQEMGLALGWLDTPQAGAIASWLAASSGAPGADADVLGLGVSFLVRGHGYTKETFGGVTASCGTRMVDRVVAACRP